jgi:hypothetical protein
MSQINAYTEKTSPDLTDEYILQETGGGTTKKIQHTTLLETVKPYYNYIYNPDGNIDQDDFSGTAPSTGKYTLDMWKWSSGGTNLSTLTVKRNAVVGEGLEVNDLAESAIHVDITVAATGGSGAQQTLFFPFVDFDTKMIGDTFTWAFRAKIPAGESIVAYFIQTGGSTETLNITGTGDWEDYVLTDVIDNTTTEVKLFLRFLQSPGIIAGAGDYYFKHHRLYKGSDYKPYQPRGFQGDLEKCMSVYEKSYLYGIAPGNNPDPNGAITFRSSITASALYGIDRKFVVPKITNPTMTFYSTQSGTADRVYNQSATADLTKSGTFSSSQYSTGYFIATANATDGNVILAHFVADCRP